MPVYDIGDNISYNSLGTPIKLGKIVYIEQSAGYPIYKVNDGEIVDTVFRHNINEKLAGDMEPSEVIELQQALLEDETEQPEASTTSADQPTTECPNQFVDLSEKELNAFCLAQQNESTVRKTLAHVNVFTSFIRKKAENRAIHTIPPTELDPLIGNFFVSVRKQNGDEYEPCYLKNIQNSLERHLKNRKYPVSLMNGREFHSSREMLKAKQVNLKKQGRGNRPFAAVPLTTDEVDLMWENGQLGSNDPETLLHTLWWQNTVQFGMRAGIKEHMAMCWGDIVLKKTSDRKEYLEKIIERQTKTRPGCDPENIRNIKPTAFATGDERCPVRIYQLYAENRPLDMCQADSPFYLGTIHNPRPGQIWFRRQRLGPNKLQTFMPNMVKCAGIETTNRKTNSSARKFQIQSLNDCGVVNTHIQQLTGHKNVQSINKYSKLNINQKQQYSLSLSRPSAAGPLVPFQKRPATSTVSCASDHDEAIEGSLSKYSRHDRETVTSRSNTGPISLFTGATISGGTINITIQPVSPSQTSKCTVQSIETQSPS